MQEEFLLRNELVLSFLNKIRWMSSKNAIDKCFSTAADLYWKNLETHEIKEKLYFCVKPNIEIFYF